MSLPDCSYGVVKSPLGYCAVAGWTSGLYSSSLPCPTRREAVRAAGIGHVVPEVTDQPIIALALDELARFLRGERVEFTVPLNLSVDAEFTRIVLEACAELRWGQVVTYGELGRRAGRPEAARAVGGVMARNPLPLFIPCHRVVGAGGHLTGYGGGVLLKSLLLEREGVEVKEGRVVNCSL